MMSYDLDEILILFMFAFGLVLGGASIPVLMLIFPALLFVGINAPMVPNIFRQF